MIMAKSPCSLESLRALALTSVGVSAGVSSMKMVVSFSFAIAADNLGQSSCCNLPVRNRD